MKPVMIAQLHCQTSLHGFQEVELFSFFFLHFSFQLETMYLMPALLLLFSMSPVCQATDLPGSYTMLSNLATGFDRLDLTILRCPLNGPSNPHVFLFAALGSPQA